MNRSPGSVASVRGRAARGSRRGHRLLLRGLVPLGLAALLITGCAHQKTDAPSERAPVNLSGYSAAFREGFGDGCDTVRGSRKRKEVRYTEDDQYRRGWDDGLAICKGK